MPVCVGTGVVTPLPGVVVVWLVVVEWRVVVVVVLLVVGALLVVVEWRVVVGGLVIDDVVVVKVLGVVVELVIGDLVVVDVVVVVSSVNVPTTQYSLLVSRSGQVIPGLSPTRLSSVSRQSSARLWQVSPLLTGVVKMQSTLR